ncbi:MAG: hypothetical protein QOJ64_410, partial [Acidobacteriota bacterium]|nr:hypothetical protein [Acidobacteriota bacterium]
CRRSIADSNATVQGWFVTAAYRSARIHQLVVKQSATNYQFSSFLMADVFIAEDEFQTERRRITNRWMRVESAGLSSTTCR